MTEITECPICKGTGGIPSNLNEFIPEIIKGELAHETARCPHCSGRGYILLTDGKEYIVRETVTLREKADE